jgi:RimJ/RimL family protein N-acetyltransferase
VRLEPWGAGDLALLQALLGDPAMMEHLGGPEAPEAIVERQARYTAPAEPGAGRQLKIVDEATGAGIGWVGFWERTWHEAPVYEIGWAVLPAFQGRGIAGAATAGAIAALRAERRHRFLHAFPAVGNPPSNGICRKLRFTLVEACDVEYPPGHWMRCNDWRLDLVADGVRQAG